MSAQEKPAEIDDEQSETNNADSGFAVGAKKNPDGSLDLSHALKMHDPDGKLTSSYEELKKREVAERANKLKIPEAVKPGSANMVWHTMNNAIFVNQEAANQARENGKADERREARIQAQKMLQEVFEMTTKRFFRELIKVGSDTNQSHDTEAVYERVANLTANEMYDLVQKHIIDYYESLQEEGGEHVMALGSTLYPIEDILKAAHDYKAD